MIAPSLTMTNRSFKNCFWGGDLTCSKGFNTLTQRNKSGKKMCQELEEYLKRRSKLELEFGKELSNLAASCFKSMNGTVGDLEAALSYYKHELASMARAHEAAGTFFKDQSDAIRIFRENQSDTKKKIEDELKKAQDSKVNQVKEVSKLKKTYHEKCKDRDACEENTKILDKDATFGKRLEKMKTKLVNAGREQEKADDNYKSGVIHLESLTSDWESKMEKACETVQGLDENRIEYIRQELWATVNADSQLALDVDNICETVRQRLEVCDVDKDIQMYLASSSTGTIKPQHIQFEEYRDKTSSGSETSSGRG